MANYTKTTIGKENRIELHEKLSLTGAEISLNELPAGANVPFVHSHKENEEIYGILSGNGKAIIDGEEISLSTGDWLKITPAAKRQFFASDISGIIYICIQVKGNYLFLYVTTTPTTEVKKTIGASLTNKNSNPCSIVPATANSGSL